MSRSRSLPPLRHARSRHPRARQRASLRPPRARFALAITLAMLATPRATAPVSHTQSHNLFLVSELIKAVFVSLTSVSIISELNHHKVFVYTHSCVYLSDLNHHKVFVYTHGCMYSLFLFCLFRSPKGTTLYLSCPLGAFLGLFLYRLYHFF